jgi:DNA end-binding protein Ku
MPARAYWQGQIRLALVSIPVQVFSATKSAARISFNQIHKPTGKRIKYEKVVPGVGAVEASDIVKGYEVEKGKYVILTEDEIEDVKLEAKRTIDLIQFVDAEEIDSLYFEKPYFVSPEDDDNSAEAYVVLRDALRETGKIGIGHIVARGHSNLVALKPYHKGLMIETLRYADEVQKPDAFYAEVPDSKPDEELLSLAEELIARKTKPFDPVRSRRSRNRRSVPRSSTSWRPSRRASAARNRPRPRRPRRAPRSLPPGRGRRPPLRPRTTTRARRRRRPSGNAPPEAIGGRAAAGVSSWSQPKPDHRR